MDYGWRIIAESFSRNSRESGEYYGLNLRARIDSSEDKIIDCILFLFKGILVKIIDLIILFAV
jgi:hypothetical protein